MPKRLKIAFGEVSGLRRVKRKALAFYNMQGRSLAFSYDIAKRYAEQIC